MPQPAAPRPWLNRRPRPPRCTPGGPRAGCRGPRAGAEESRVVAAWVTASARTCSAPLFFSRGCSGPCSWDYGPCSGVLTILLRLRWRYRTARNGTYPSPFRTGAPGDASGSTVVRTDELNTVALTCLCEGGLSRQAGLPEEQHIGEAGLEGGCGLLSPHVHAYRRQGRDVLSEVPLRPREVVAEVDRGHVCPRNAAEALVAAPNHQMVPLVPEVGAARPQDGPGHRQHRQQHNPAPDAPALPVAHQQAQATHNDGDEHQRLKRPPDALPLRADQQSPLAHHKRLMPVLHRSLGGGLPRAAADSHPARGSGSV